ncbi:MAG: hypothetical protein R2851_25815 [Caldilineaceae bacterium]
MGYNIFIRRILNDELITIDGDGTDSRNNTFVADCISGLVAALRSRTSAWARSTTSAAATR